MFCDDHYKICLCCDLSESLVFLTFIISSEFAAKLKVLILGRIVGY